MQTLCRVERYVVGLDSTIVAMFVLILVELSNTVLVSTTNITKLNKLNSIRTTGKFEYKTGFGF